jgi:hypothetical protein
MNVATETTSKVHHFRAISGLLRPSRRPRFVRHPNDGPKREDVTDSD